MGFDKDDEMDIFSDAMKDVTPIPRPNLAERVPRQPPRATPTESSDEQHEATERGFRRNGIQRGVLRKLQNGQIQIEAEIDLHGCTVPKAKEQLIGFLYNSQATDRQRAVRIIHGKGRGSPNQKSILKEEVDGCLRHSNAVLAFCEAGPTDGGSGAVRVLLKRR